MGSGSAVCEAGGAAWRATRQNEDGINKGPRGLALFPLCELQESQLRRNKGTVLPRNCSPGLSWKVSPVLHPVFLKKWGKLLKDIEWCEEAWNHS